MRTLENVNVKGLRVLVRVDFDVPVDKDGNVLDDFRLKQNLPTIKYLIRNAKQVIIMCHMGRPKGKKVKRLTTDKVAIQLMKNIGKKVVKLDDCIDVDIPDSAKVVVLENLRFHKAEHENDDEFSKKLASFADLYVNDAFASSYNKHCSIIGVPKFLPSCAGFQFEKEVKNLHFAKAKKPFVVLLGGSKLSTKFHLINSLLPKIDKLLLGGAMVFTFYKAMGLEIGKSLIEEEQLVEAKLLLHNEKILLPKDILVSNTLDEKAKVKTVAFDKIPKNWIGVDIGEDTISLFKKELNKAKTIFWNGPMGVYEVDKFSHGSFDLAKHMALSKAKTIAGGGDSSAVIDKLGIRSDFSHISTGGGSSLELLEKGTLPGIEVLKN